jgi:hypothetical protein
VQSGLGNAPIAIASRMFVVKIGTVGDQVDHQIVQGQASDNQNYGHPLFLFFLLNL